MTDEEYFDWHIPHRVNLLVTFRRRYSGRCPRDTISREQYRDLFRCAKDMSFLMVRFFCNEMGIHFSRKTNDVEDSQGWHSQFGVYRLRKAILHGDPRYGALCEVLRTANRAVAHMDSKDVDHPFRTEFDDQKIFDVIDWIEMLISLNIYVAAGRDLQHAMALPQNVM